MQIRLSDDWRHEEPLAFLVKNFNTTMSEYEIFKLDHEAMIHAERQYVLSEEAGDPQDWHVYPLYAADPAAAPSP